MVQPRNPDEGVKTAALFIARSLVNPDDEHLVDVSNISIRMAHSLTMLKALIEQMDVFIKQITERQKWQVRRYVRQQMLLEQRKISYAKDLRESAKTEEEKKFIQIPEVIWTSEYQKKYIEEADKEITGIDVFNKGDMFASDFFLQYCHVSRGKEFKLADTMQVLADSEITNSSQQEDGSYGSSRAS